MFFRGKTNEKLYDVMRRFGGEEEPRLQESVERLRLKARGLEEENPRKCGQKQQKKHELRSKLWSSTFRRGISWQCVFLDIPWITIGDCQKTIPRKQVYDRL